MQHVSTCMYTPDWKVWKLGTQDYENLIVNTLGTSKLRTQDLGCALQTFQTGVYLIPVY